ncbi:MAG TPA: contact-dependent growth inhibition system immunity protein [Trinickia sp.]|nr:contact-dependent growth inhibition system immunity protein [Trinickia sp.]
MKSDQTYPELDQLFGGYLNQDYYYIGETIEEIVTCYKNEITPSMRQAVLAEIEKFKREHSEDLDAEFYKIYGCAFNPKLWGHTTASFFDEMKHILQR